MLSPFYFFSQLQFKSRKLHFPESHADGFLDTIQVLLIRSGLKIRSKYGRLHFCLLHLFLQEHFWFHLPVNWVLVLVMAAATVS